MSGCDELKHPTYVMAFRWAVVLAAAGSATATGSACVVEIRDREESANAVASVDSIVAVGGWKQGMR